MFQHHAILLGVQAALRSTNVIESVKIQLEGVGFANAPYDNVLFTFHPSFASQHLLAVGNWDGPRRHAVRKVLREAKENFHQHPRPWWVHRLRWYEYIGLKKVIASTTK